METKTNEYINYQPEQTTTGNASQPYVVLSDDISNKTRCTNSEVLAAATYCKSREDCSCCNWFQGRKSRCVEAFADEIIRLNQERIIEQPNNSFVTLSPEPIINVVTEAINKSMKKYKKAEQRNTAMVVKPHGNANGKTYYSCPNCNAELIVRRGTQYCDVCGQLLEFVDNT